MDSCEIVLKITGSDGSVKSGSFSLPVKIGRDIDNDIVFKNNSIISRHHLTIIEQNRKIKILNFGKNGYILNGKHQDANKFLSKGDKIEFTKTKKKIEVVNLCLTAQRINNEHQKSAYKSTRIYTIIQTLQSNYENRIRNQNYYIIVLSATLLVILTLALTSRGSKNNDISEKIVKTEQELDTVKKKLDNNKRKLVSLSNAIKTPSKNIHIPQKTRDTNDDILKRPLSEMELSNLFNKDFKDEVVEVIYDFGGERLTENGFVVNGNIFSPTIYNIASIKSVSVKFLMREDNYEVYVDKIERPFLRYKFVNKELILNYREVLKELKTENIDDKKIYIIEYIQRKSRHQFQIHEASPQHITKNMIVCKVAGGMPRLGALAVTQEDEVLGLMTASEDGNMAIFETLPYIQAKLTDH